MEPARLWPDRPADSMQTFFIRIPEGAERLAVFQVAARALRSVRWHDFGKYTLRLPGSEPWLVVDWHALLELPSEAIEAISQQLRQEVFVISAVTGHGRSSGRLYLRRLIDGRVIPSHTEATKEDRVTPVDGPPDRLPASIPVEDLPELAAALRLPEDTLPADSLSVEITCVPAKLAVWAAIFVVGGLAALLLV